MAPPAQSAIKRLLDVIVAAFGLVLLSPLLLTIAAVILIESPGPLFYRAERVGYRRRPLRMLKFRKMHVGAMGPRLTTRLDPRLTRVGALLAGTRLDELPQLWHVLRGDMSLIGPRPEDPQFVARFAAEYDDILRVRPGIAGPSQLAFADEARILPPDDPIGHYLDVVLPQKIAIDRRYAQAPGIGRDVAIGIATLRTILLHQPIAVNRSTGALTRRRRPAVDLERPAEAPAGALGQTVVEAEPAAVVPAAVPIE